VNAVLLLIGLLVLSSLGSLLTTRRSGGGAGLTSGVEYAALGFVLGPQALGLVGAKDLTAFEPVVQVAIGWLAFAVGLDFGFSDDRRVRGGSFALGSMSAGVTGGGVAVATWFATRWLKAGLTGTERVLLSGALGAACSETSRRAARWVADRYRVRAGPLTRSLDELAHVDSLLPLVAVAVLFALDPSRDVVCPMPLWQWPAVTVGSAILLGAGAALLLRSEIATEDAWGVLFGVSLLAIGVAARLALATLTTTFFMGIAVAALSSHRRELRAMVGPTERPVLLPALLLAGARLDFRATPALPWLAAVAIGARVAAKILVGCVLCAGSRSARKAGVLVGLSLMSSGSLAICVGLAFALRFPGTVGDTVLAVAVLSAIVGELLGPARLRRSLLAAGEIEEATAHTSAPDKALV